MLKLLKHDIKDSYLEILILNGIMLGLTLFVVLGIAVKSAFLLSVGMFACSIVLMAAFVMVIRTVIRSFHTKLFTNNGYLTLTTPVSVDKILLSKILISMLWIIVTVVSVFFCALIVISTALNSLLSSFGGSFDLLVSLLKSIVENPLETFQAILLGLMSALSFIATLIFVLVLINTVIRTKKYKTLVGILIYIGISVVTSQITLQTVGRITNPDIAYTLSVLLYAAWSVAFYFISRYLIINKLELE